MIRDEKEKKKESRKSPARNLEKLRLKLDLNIEDWKVESSENNREGTEK